MHADVHSINQEVFQSWVVAGFHPVRHSVKVTGLFNHYHGLLFILAAYLLSLQGDKTLYVLMKKQISLKLYYIFRVLNVMTFVQKCQETSRQNSVMWTYNVTEHCK